MRLRVKPDDPCIIQHECGPDEWEDWYDPRECIREIVREEGAQTPAGTIADDEHFTDCPVLAGSGLYQFPTKVSPGDTVTITNAVGGWSGSSQPGALWGCPEGKQYYFGQCQSLDMQNAGAGAPFPDMPQMRLVAYYDGLYYDAYNTTIEIPASAQQSQLLFLANDADLADNQGSITFCVDVLHPTSHVEDFTGMDWTIPLDMENTDYAWLINVSTANGNAPNGYVVGVGVQAGLSGNYVAADLRLHIAGGYAEVRAIVAEIYSAGDIPVANEGLHVATSDNISAHNYTQLKTFSGDVWTTLRVDIPSGEAQINPGFDTWLDFEAKTGGHSNPSVVNAIIRKIWIAGTGTPPTPVHS